MVCCTFGKMNKGSTTEERKEFNMTTLVWFTSFLLENLFYYDHIRVPPTNWVSSRRTVSYCYRACYKGKQVGSRTEGAVALFSERLVSPGDTFDEIQL